MKVGTPHVDPSGHRSSEATPSSGASSEAHSLQWQARRDAVQLLQDLHFSAGPRRWQQVPEPFLSVPAGLSGKRLRRHLRAACLAAPRLQLGRLNVIRCLHAVVDRPVVTGSVLYAAPDVYHDERNPVRSMGRIITVEHLFPRSLIPANHPQREEIVTDMHGLALCDALANVRRDTQPYGRVEQEHWVMPGGMRGGLDAAGRRVVEPPRSRKGDIARRLLMMAILYKLDLTEEQARELVRWSLRHPPTMQERIRNELVAYCQGRRNPLPDLPHTVALLWGGEAAGAP